MNFRSDGGPAFPVKGECNPVDGTVYFGGLPGMSLLDYFAAKAMPVVCMGFHRVDRDIYGEVALRSYGVARAMLAERWKHLPFQDDWPLSDPPRQPAADGAAVMTDKHTPGPWTIHCGRWDKEILIQEPGVTVDYDDVDQDEAMANARLIAAAPDMLAALLNVRSLISEAAMTGFNCHDGNWAERLFASQAVTSAAIAKATGAGS